MTREETKRRFQAWCQREIGNNCSNEDYAMFNNIMALLEQETVSKEAYDSEHLARKEAEQELFEIKSRINNDCISREAVIAIASDSCLDLNSYEDTKEFCDEIKDLPPMPGLAAEKIECVLSIKEFSVVEHEKESEYVAIFPSDTPEEKIDKAIYYQRDSLNIPLFKGLVIVPKEQYDTVFQPQMDILSEYNKRIRAHEEKL